MSDPQLERDGYAVSTKTIFVLVAWILGTCVALMLLGPFAVLLLIPAALVLCFSPHRHLLRLKAADGRPLLAIHDEAEEEVRFRKQIEKELGR